jgi:hypothetical protein
MVTQAPLLNGPAFYNDGGALHFVSALFYVARAFI